MRPIAKKGNEELLLNKEDILRRLKPCGCCKTRIEQIQDCVINDNARELFQLLKNCQRDHQEGYDEACRHIDCIDYLIYELQRK